MNQELRSALLASKSIWEVIGILSQRKGQNKPLDTELELHLSHLVDDLCDSQFARGQWDLCRR